jgi:hypothetical protein
MEKSKLKKQEKLIEEVFAQEHNHAFLLAFHKEDVQFMHLFRWVERLFKFQVDRGFASLEMTELLIVNF